MNLIKGNLFSRQNLGAFIFLSLFNLGIAYPQNSPEKDQNKDLKLVWSDEFDGTALNEEFWSYEIGDGCPKLCGWGNKELEYYRKENVLVSDGMLIITAKSESFENRDYTSGRIKTSGKKSFTYGRMEIRAKLPKGKGIWPAIWMLGESISSIGWPAAGEIDIIELKGSIPNKVGGTLHYKNSEGRHQNSGAKRHELVSGDYSDEFHLFSLEWDETQMIWSVDNIPFNKVVLKDLNVSEEKNPFLKEFYFIFNLAVGGFYDGNPDETTVFPQTLVVDYIRVYQ
ncbi:MAG: glycoside hydrolase family 16 protein [Bacteroidales bacterium]|nr:glycoside hydrolase family 16 protein [Bacteroidales bacterium]MCF8390903.1 glycoside hydrolase family 16 protein [Bacteroidales bacterium]